MTYRDRSLVVALSLMLLGVVCSPSVAQITPFSPGGAGSGLRLSKDDIERMHNAASRLYEGRSIGTVERWRNPQTGNAGSVKLIRDLTIKGMPCRRMIYTIRQADDPTRPSNFTVTWCKVSDEWKLYEPAPSR
jgi:hypothetical protein